MKRAKKQAKRYPNEFNSYGYSVRNIFGCPFCSSPQLGFCWNYKIQMKKILGVKFYRIVCYSCGSSMKWHLSKSSVWKEYTKHVAKEERKLNDFR